MSINNLAQFKQAIKEAFGEKRQIRVVRKMNGETTDSGFVPITHSQTNAFARSNEKGGSVWSEYGKVSQWDFSNGRIRNMQNKDSQNYIEYYFEPLTR